MTDSKDLPRVPEWLNSDLPLSLEMLREISWSKWFTSFFRTQKSTGVNVPPEFRDRLLQLGLVKETDSGLAPLFRINRIDDRFFLTDCPWNMGHGGSYSYADESIDLLQVARSRKAPQVIVDLSTGCGHTIIGYPDQTKPVSRIGLDINSRSIEFASLNASLNRVDVELSCADTTIDLGNELQLPDDTMVVGNLPFSIVPSELRPPNSVDGGLNGLAPTIKTTKAIFSKFSNVRGLFLVNTLGKESSSGPVWQIEEELEALDLPVKFTITEGARLWRVNGELTQTNPAKVEEALPLKGKCESMRTSSGEESTIHFQQLAAELIDQGWTMLGRGILEVNPAIGMQ